MFSLRLPALSLLFALSASAAPAWQATLTNPAEGSHPRLKPGALDYEISWKGMIRSGRLRMEFAPPGVNKPGAYVVRSFSTSLGAASKLFPYRGDFWSELHPETLRPRYFHSIEVDDEETTTTNRFPTGRVDSREITREPKTGKSRTRDRTFTITPAFDLFSAMLHVRSQPLRPGDTIRIIIHPFDEPYLLRVRVVGREIHHDRPAIRLEVGMNKIDRKTLQLLPYKKLKRDASLWLSDDADRVPIEFRAAVFIGDVRAVLTRRERF